MAVTMIFSPTLSGAPFSDSLAGGGSGLSFGNVINGDFAPLVSKVNNTGHQNMYLYHDAVVEPVTNVELFIQQYGASSGSAYGGQRSAVNDFNAFVQLGADSGHSKNNVDGQSGGLWMDMVWNSTTVNQFDRANFPTIVRVFGAGGAGINLSTGIIIHQSAMVYNNVGETSAIAPQAGNIGKANDASLGDNAHVKLRTYLPVSWIEGGIFQIELACTYRYTA